MFSASQGLHGILRTGSGFRTGRPEEMRRQNLKARSLPWHCKPAHPRWDSKSVGPEDGLTRVHADPSPQLM